jgi:hypothetical protein
MSSDKERRNGNRRHSDVQHEVINTKLDNILDKFSEMSSNCKDTTQRQWENISNNGTKIAVLNERTKTMRKEAAGSGFLGGGIVTGIISIIKYYLGLS